MPTAPSSTSSLHVLQVNTSDQGGGAETTALALHRGFLEMGATSVLVVGERKTENRGVIDIRRSPHFDYRRVDGWILRSGAALRSHAHRFLGLPAYRDSLAHHVIEISGHIPEVAHVHNLHGGYFDLEALPALGARCPLVFSWHDLWMATGHCATPGSCDRFQTGCGRCPDLARPESAERDATRFNLWRKLRLLRTCGATHVVPSVYARDRLLKSLVAPRPDDVLVIPLGVDNHIFRPPSAVERTLSRERLGLPAGATVVATHCQGGASSPFRDFAQMREVVSDLASRRDRPLYWLIQGGPEASHEDQGQLHTRHLPYAAERAVVRDVLWSAGAYLMAPRDEAFGLAIAEAMACGLAVAVSGVGAVREMVAHGSNGLVADGSAAGLSSCLAAILENQALANQLGSEAAGFIARERTWGRSIRRHLDLYERLRKHRGRPRRASSLEDHERE